jgi:hypothetical protein
MNNFNNNQDNKNFLKKFYDSYKDSIFSVFSSTGRTLTNVFLLALACGAIDVLWLEKECTREADPNGEYCQYQKIDRSVYNNLLTSLFLVWIIELALRKKADEDKDSLIKQLEDSKRASIEGIREIVENSRATTALNAVYITAGDYLDVIRTKLKNLKGGETVKILCFSQILDVLINDELGADFLLEKLEKGCEFKIITIHQDSMLLTTLNNSGFPRGKGMILEKLESITKKTSKIPDKVRGKIKIRRHENLYSPFSYFSVQSNDNNPKIDYHLISICCSQEQGMDYSAVGISDDRLIKQADNHFKYLWNKCEQNKEVDNGDMPETPPLAAQAYSSQGSVLLPNYKLP